MIKKIWLHVSLLCVSWLDIHINNFFEHYWVASFSSPCRHFQHATPTVHFEYIDWISVLFSALNISVGTRKNKVFIMICTHYYYYVGCSISKFSIFFFYQQLMIKNWFLNRGNILKSLDLSPTVKCVVLFVSCVIMVKLRLIFIVRCAEYFRANDFLTAHPGRNSKIIWILFAFYWCVYYA